MIYLINITIEATKEEAAHINAVFYGKSKEETGIIVKDLILTQMWNQVDGLHIREQIRKTVKAARIAIDHIPLEYIEIPEVLTFFDEIQFLHHMTITIQPRTKKVSK